MTHLILKGRRFASSIAPGSERNFLFGAKIRFFFAFLQSVGFIGISRITKAKTFDKIYFFVFISIESASRKVSKIDYLS